MITVFSLPATAVSANGRVSKQKIEIHKIQFFYNPSESLYSDDSEMGWFIILRQVVPEDIFNQS